MTSNQMSTVRTGMTPETVFATTEAVAREVSKVVVGQEKLVHRLLTALFASIPHSCTRSGSGGGCGHVLLEGVAGVARTRAVATGPPVRHGRSQRGELARG